MIAGSSQAREHVPEESWLLVGGRSHIARATARLIHQRDAEIWRTTRDGSDGSIRLTLTERLPDLPQARRTGTAVIFAATPGHAACEADVDGTRRVNVEATVALCDVLAGLGWHVVFLSSDAVFPEFVEPPDRDDGPKPRSEYGTQKRLVEQHLETLGSDASVLRLSKVINVRSEPWATWFREMSRVEDVVALADYHLSPLAASHAAAAIVAVASARRGGVWQAPGAASISYYEFLRLLRADLGLRGHVNPTWRGVVGDRHRVPTQMDASRLVEAGLWSPPSIHEVCDAIGRELGTNEEECC